MAQFEKDFLLGAATSAHQVEGNNIHSDCWLQEHMSHSSFVEPSGEALDHYHRYREDIMLLRQAGLNAYRFSIEWARIEPEEGRYDQNEIEHYRNVISFCRDQGIEPIVTLHHFSSPAWLIRQGGWEADSTPFCFARYARHVAEELGGDIRWLCTINEANIGLQISAVAERIMRQMMADSTDGQVQVGLNLQEMMRGKPEARRENFQAFGTEIPAVFVTARSAHGDEIVMRAHAEARRAIRETAPHIRVGWTLSLQDVQAIPGGEAEADREWEREFRHYLPAMQGDDFLGVQNYTRMLLGPTGTLPAPAEAELTMMDYEFYPEGIAHVLRKAAQDFKGDLLVTENGVATVDDTRRQAFIQSAASGVHNCIADGLPVKGYLYWSLLDNFEWQKGYGMTFGLVAVDRSTQKRTPRDSLYVLGRMREKP